METLYEAQCSTPEGTNTYAITAEELVVTVTNRRGRFGSRYPLEALNPRPGEFHVGLRSWRLLALLSWFAASLCGLAASFKAFHDLRAAAGLAAFGIVFAAIGWLLRQAYWSNSRRMWVYSDRFQGFRWFAFHPDHVIRGRLDEFQARLDEAAKRAADHQEGRGGGSLAAELESLDSMRQKGILAEEEFRSLKEELIATVGQ